MNYCFTIKASTEKECSEIEYALRSNFIRYSIHKEFNTAEEQAKSKKKAKARYFTMKKYWAKVRKAKLNNGDAN